MKAALIRTTGTPDVIQWTDMQQPVPDKGQVLVRTEAVAVNPIDTYIRSGIVKAALPDHYIIGCDIAGIVEAVGPGVERFSAGDRVWAVIKDSSDARERSPNSARSMNSGCIQFR